MAHTTDATEKRTTTSEELNRAVAGQTGPSNPDHPGDLTDEEKIVARLNGMVIV